MSRVMARMHQQFDENQLLQVMKSMTGTPEVDAGYAGEGHRDWRALTLYSRIHGLAANASKLPVIDQLLVETGLVFRLARFMRLAPGGEICKHTDSFLGGGVVRIHVPIRAHTDARLYIDGERCDWDEGQLWFGDFSKPHWSVNNSEVDRVHLVMDVELDAKLIELLEDGEAKESLVLRINNRHGREADQAALERFGVFVRLPPGFAVPGLEMPPLEQETDAEVTVSGDELLVTVNGQPMLRAVPVSEEMVDLVGLPSEARLHYRFNGAIPTAVCMMIGLQSLDLKVIPCTETASA